MSAKHLLLVCHYLGLGLVPTILVTSLKEFFVYKEKPNSDYEAVWEGRWSAGALGEERGGASDPTWGAGRLCAKSKPESFIVSLPLSPIASHSVLIKIYERTSL